MTTAVWRETAMSHGRRLAYCPVTCCRSVLAGVCAVVMLGVAGQVLAAEASGAASGAKTAGAASAAVQADTAQELLGTLISSGALTVEEAQKLVDRLRLEEQKKQSDSLVNYLVESKTLSLQDAQQLLNDLRAGKGKTVKTDAKPVAPEPVAEAEKAAKPAEAEKPPANRVRAAFLSDSDRARIRDELKQEVMATARKESWTQPDAIPEWVRRIRLSGDVLLRAQGDFLDASNDPALNFQAINAGAPVDIFLPSSATPQKVLTIPYLNTTENRQSTRFRARLSLQSEVTEKVDTGLRLATGSAGNPGSTTQVQGNDFNKVGFLLDRVWLRYRAGTSPGAAAEKPLDRSLSLIGGRIPSPWLAPTEVIWDKDLGFDGFALQYKAAATERIHAFATTGAFAISNTEPHYPSLSPFKTGSRDKWLFGVQLGADAQLKSGFGMRASMAYFDFADVVGQQSSPCYAPGDKVPCDSDNSRPGYVQKGNTLFALRLLDRPNPATDPEFQYFGLASSFRVVDINVGLDIPLYGAVHAQLDFEATRNLAFNAAGINARGPVNNFASCPADTPNCAAQWVGGGDAWQTQLRVGHAKIDAAREWNTVFGYRYVESDAVVDAFTDSDFHLGGTNAKGFYVGGNLGLAHNLWVGLKLMSANEVAGWKYSADVMQLDLNARF